MDEARITINGHISSPSKHRSVLADEKVASLPEFRWLSWSLGTVRGRSG